MINIEKISMSYDIYIYIYIYLSLYIYPEVCKYKVYGILIMNIQHIQNQIKSYLIQYSKQQIIKTIIYYYNI